jgi:von Willebrand factor type A domain
MHSQTNRIAVAVLTCTALIFMSLKSSKSPQKETDQTFQAFDKKAKAPKIQVAILLDVSGSMDGLIEQAKAQLWNMVNVMGKAKCDGVAPQIEIALYEYGRSNNPVSAGYVKQLSPFSNDLDELSKKLFALTTNGGDEFCGQVIYTSLNELKWSADTSNYKVIFIAGNEDFLQGKLHYTKACAEAKNKGVIVNTIYCGDKMQGIAEHWNLNAECGTGSYTNINADAKVEEIPTPYDSVIYALNTKLNGTYVGYGSLGYANTVRQENMDYLNTQMSPSAGIARSKAKANDAVYNNSSWDMVDAYKKDSLVFLKKIDKATLHDSLKNKSIKELEILVQQKKNERNAIQTQIINLNVQRDQFIQVERSKKQTGQKEATLETEVERIIKAQAVKHRMVIQ